MVVDALLVTIAADGTRVGDRAWGRRNGDVSGGLGIDHGDGVDAGQDGTISLGAAAETPPFLCLRAPTKTSRPRGTVAVPTTPLEAASRAVVDPAGTLDTPTGTTLRFGIRAALARIAPTP